jgi:hypothetical protein
METNNTAGGAVFSLPMLLNILVRRRLLIAGCTALGIIAGVAYGIVVKPLYLATVQIRPGIVAYTADGSPLRGWAREDIINWFGSSMFWAHMREQAGFEEYKGPPVIDASYAPSTIQFMAGGDVITLNNLSRDPDEAVRVLNTSMAAFNIMGRRDSLGGDLSLAMRGIEIAMDDILSDIQIVEGKEERAQLEIEELQREIGVVDYEKRKVELEIATMREQNEWRKRTVTDLTAEVEAGAARLAQAEELLALSLQAEKETGGSLGDTDGGDPVGTVLRQTASREQAGRVGELLARVHELSATVSGNRIKADSLQVQFTETEFEMDRLKLMSEIVLTKKVDDIRQRITDRDIWLKRDLPSEKAHLEAKLEGKQVQLETISPLELVGTTTVTDKPVRPRKMRALSILTMLALLGGLGLALVVEYLVVNRQEILRQPGK